MVLIQSSVHSPVLVCTADCTTPREGVDPLQNLHISNNKIHEDIIEIKTDVGYEVQELPGRGYGLVATKRFYPGDLIIREKPIIDMPDKIFRYIWIYNIKK